MKVAVTGTPGTGKTSVAKKLAEESGLEYVSINELAREKDCILSYDEERDSEVVDVKKLRKGTEELEDCVLDGHLSHFLEVDKVVVLRCKPSALGDRLVEKGWDEEKVGENVDAEIIGVIEGEARNSNDEVYSIDTTKKDVARVVEIIMDIIEGEADERYQKHFDWIEQDGVDVL